MRPKVFISHSASGDTDAMAFVQRLRERLREWGIDPWLDRDRLREGQVWNDEIRTAIQRCDAAIIVMTERYLREGAHYARDEALLFAQRAATEAFDDFRLLVLLAPGVTPDRLADEADWRNLEISRRQVITLNSLDPDRVDALRPAVKSLLERYCSGSVPLVLREHYTNQVGQSSLAAILEQACGELDMELVGGDVTPRRFVNVLLGATPELRQTFAVIERCLSPWREVLDEKIRCGLGWDSIAFTWLDDQAASKIAAVTRTVGAANRRLLVVTTGQDDTVKLHLRRAREYVAPFSDTGPHPGQITREGIIRAICDEIKAKRAPRERRNPLTIATEEVEDLAADLNEAAGRGRSNPLVVVLGGDLCFEDLLRGLPDLFSNVILVAMADENQVESMGPQCIVLRPQQEAEVLAYLDLVTQ